MKVKDLYKKLSEQEYGSRYLFFEDVQFFVVGFDEHGEQKLLERFFWNDDASKQSKYGDLEVLDYDWDVDQEYDNFVIVKCQILLDITEGEQNGKEKNG